MMKEFQVLIFECDLGHSFILDFRTLRFQCDPCQQFTVDWLVYYTVLSLLIYQAVYEISSCLYIPLFITASGQAKMMSPCCGRCTLGDEYN